MEVMSQISLISPPYTNVFDAWRMQISLKHKKCVKVRADVEDAPISMLPCCFKHCYYKARIT